MASKTTHGHVKHTTGVAIWQKLLTLSEGKGRWKVMNKSFFYSPPHAEHGTLKLGCQDPVACGIP
jgi:hypothetical protein